MLEHKISWKILKIFTLECLYDDLVLILNVLYVTVKFAFWAFSYLLFHVMFYMRRFHGFLEDSETEVNKSNLRTFRFCLRSQDQPASLIF